MNPQNDQYNIDKVSNPTPSVDPYAFLAAYDAPVQPPKKNKNKVVLSLISVLVVILVIVGVLVLQKDESSNTSAGTTSNTLAIENYGNLQVPYPSNWSTIDQDALPSGFIGGFSGTDPITGSLYYGSEGIMAQETPVADFTESDQKNITDTVVVNLQKSADEKRFCLEGFKLSAQRTFSNTSSFGVDLEYSCSINIVGAAFVEKTRYIYIGDGLLYQVSITSTPEADKNSVAVFSTLLENVLPKQQKS